MEAAGAGITVTVILGECPCTSLWKPSALPANPSASDSGAYELGVKFQSDINGFITGIRFYKGPANTGTHVGNLWTSAGTLLATATFTNESATGWQQVNFGTPVAITANTTYVASYHTPNGGYAFDPAYFTTTRDAPPLHAPTSASSGGNGVYSPGGVAFPTQTFNANNYWVDVVFAQSLDDVTPPVISAIKATAIDSARATVSWTTNEQTSTRIDYGTNPAILTATLDSLPPGTLTVDPGQLRRPARRVTGGPAGEYDLLLPGHGRRSLRQHHHGGGAELHGAGSDAARHGLDRLRRRHHGRHLRLADRGRRSDPRADRRAPSSTGRRCRAAGSKRPGAPKATRRSSTASCWSTARASRRARPTPTAPACRETTTTTPSAIYTAPHSLEFSANFSGDSFQHAGFAVTFGSASEPWAIFSTLDGGSALRPHLTPATAPSTPPIGTAPLGEFHRYRIDWKPTSVDYYIDGALGGQPRGDARGPDAPGRGQRLQPLRRDRVRRLDAPVADGDAGHLRLARRSTPPAS